MIDMSGKKTQSKKTRPDDNVLDDEARLKKALCRELSETERDQILVSSLTLWDSEKQRVLLARLPSHSAKVLGALWQESINQKVASMSETAPAERKIWDQWKALWEQWDTIAEDVGDPDGKYVVEEDYDCIYVDMSLVAADLEIAAAQMRGLVNDLLATEQARDIDLMSDLSDLINSMVDTLSDWLEPSEEGVLGPEVTQLLLEWEWGRIVRFGDSEEKEGILVENIRKFEMDTQVLTFGDTLVRSKIAQLSKFDELALFKYLREARTLPIWQDAFSKPCGLWFHMLTDLAARYDRATYLKICEDFIGDNWQMSFPVLEDLIKRRDYNRALSIVERAANSMSQTTYQEAWNPCAQLLVCRSHFGYETEERNDRIRLLQLWQKIAEALKQKDLGAALGLQVFAFWKFEDGDVMLEAFNAMPKTASKTTEALFADWRRWFATTTLHRWYERTPAICYEWVEALVDTARSETPANVSRLHTTVQRLLAEGGNLANGENRKIKSNQGGVENDDYIWALTCLTFDLEAIAPTLKLSAPTLLNALGKSKSDFPQLAATRKAWWERFDGKSLMPAIVQFWHDHVKWMIPDPKQSMAEYSTHARWLAALREINPQEATELHETWKKTCRNRRNLWRDLAKYGFSAPEGISVPRA